jgi:acyl-CoA thioester hydrolase
LLSHLRTADVMENNLSPYKRQVFYYETDKMGIVHHSNYIRWFEEARLDFMKQLGLNYGCMEERGILMPVVDVSCKYIVSLRYDEAFEIAARLEFFNGVRLVYSYKLYKAEGKILAADGGSTHCFIMDGGGKPVNLKRSDPGLYKEITNCFDTQTKRDM